MITLLRAAAIATVIIAAAQPAFAENKNAARDAFRRAQQNYNLADYGQALADFKEAYRNYEDPSFLFNIAQCERMLNHKREAARAYRTYLASATNAPNRDEVAELIRKLDQDIQAEDAASAEKRRTAEPHSVPLSVPAAAMVATQAPPPAPQKMPVYKKWWLWTIVGVAAAGAGLGLGIGLSQSPAPASANTGLGTIHPF
jgi:tetratricopeptide (TPR) repeat protein